MTTPRKERRKRKNKISFLNDIKDDFQEIEENFSTNFIPSSETDQITVAKREKNNEVNDCSEEINNVVPEKRRSSEINGIMSRKDDNLQATTAVGPNQSDLQLIKFEYEKKLAALESEVVTLREQRKQVEGEKLTTNEERLLNAIRSEKILQKKNNPVIGRSKLQNTYKINNRYFDDAIKGLVNKNIIERKQVNYTAKIKTYEWVIL